MSSSKKIGLLGGSFNPPHLGHVGACRFVLDEKKVDEVWAIPCLKHPFDKPLVSFEHRFKMCELAFAPFGEAVKVLDIEKRLGGKSYTLRTVRELQKSHPDIEFVLVVGEDVTQETRAWFGYEELKQVLPWLIVPRGTHSSVLNVSATDIRRAIHERVKEVRGLPPEIYRYILANKLYS